MAKARQKVGALFVERGWLTESTVEQLLGLQKESSERLASLAVRWKHVTEVQALSVLSEQHGVAGLDLRQVALALEHLKMVPQSLAQEFGILPIDRDDDCLWLAMTDPEARHVVEEVAFATGLTVFPYVALRATLQRFSHEAYKRAEEGHTHHCGADVPPETLSSVGGSGEVHPPKHAVIEVLPSDGDSRVAARFSWGPPAGSGGS